MEHGIYEAEEYHETGFPQAANKRPEKHKRKRSILGTGIFVVIVSFGTALWLI